MPLAKEIGFAVEVLDVDASADLEALYDQWVPVLLHEGSELCHYFLDEAHGNRIRRCRKLHQKVVNDQ